MELEELKLIADSMGYRLQKKPDYDCSCYAIYPNECHKMKNGKWKCVDRYECVYSRKKLGDQKTKCRKRGADDGQD